MRPLPFPFSSPSVLFLAAATLSAASAALGQNRSQVRAPGESVVVGKRRQVNTKPAEPAPAPEPGNEGPRPTPQQFENEPWLSPQRERLVAVVNERYMTKPDLDNRLAAAIAKDGAVNIAEPRKRAELEEKRRADFADSILDDWIMNTALALDAQKRGFSVSNQEIEEAIGKLAAVDKDSPDEVRARVKLIGMPEASLRQEIRDALMVEKFIGNIVANMDREYYRKAYNTDVSYFVIPPKVRAFHVFKAIDRRDAQKGVVKQLEGLRKELARKDPDLEKIKRMSDSDSQTAIGDMGWVGANEALEPELAAQLFKLKPGETSPVFQTGLGAHVVKVLERKEGSGYKFEDALPQIQNYLFGRTKPVVFDSIRSGYKIHVNSGGLTRWREKGESARDIAENGSRQIGAPAGSPASQTPDSPPMSLDEIYKNISAQPTRGGRTAPPPPPPPGLDTPSKIATPPPPPGDASLNDIYKSLPSRPAAPRRR